MHRDAAVHGSVRAGLLVGFCSVQRWCRSCSDRVCCFSFRWSQGGALTTLEPAGGVRMRSSRRLLDVGATALATTAATLQKAGARVVCALGLPAAVEGLASRGRRVTHEFAA